ncbi:hypothetical protein TNCV_2117401 [Trichonephila clavipes]|nr:hypothetical protein TNCV_2117401 [Trichonephila clavipes]
MRTSSVEFISRSPTPSPMERNYRRFVLLRRIFEPWQWKRRKKRNRFERRTLEENIDAFNQRSTYSPLVSMEIPLRTAYGQNLWHAAKSNAVFARRRIEMKLKLLDIRAELERERKERESVSVQPFLFFLEQTVIRATIFGYVNSLVDATVDNFIFQLDGVPPHLSAYVQEKFDEHLLHRWIGQVMDYSMTVA